MAEGGSLEKTIDGSEPFYDFNCSVCIKNKGVHSEAAYYCPRCNEYYCKHCFTQSGCDHDPIGRGNVAKWGKPSQRIFFDECPEHIGNTIQLYCPKDDVVCCAICSQAHHKLCGEPKYIPLIANGKENKESLKVVEKELRQLETKVERLIQDRTTSLAELDNIQTRIQREIREVKSKIIALLDALEQNSLDELNNFKIDLSNKIKTDLQFLSNTKAEMQEFLSKLKSPNIDESLLFSRLKLSKELIQDKKQSVSNKANYKPSEKTRFVTDTKLLNCMKSMQGLGELIFDTHNIQQVHVVGQDSKRSQGQCHLSLKINKPCKVRHKTSFNVKVKGDKQTCNILGMCQLSDGSIIVADYNNKRLKQLDSTYKITSHCTLSASPCDVCSTEEGEVAVALNSKTIQFVSVGDTLTATRCFYIDHGCYSLAYHNKCLYVISCGGSTVYVYKPSGALLHTISTDQHGTQLFSDIMYITVSSVSERLYVADRNKGLVTVDLQGNLLATYKQSELARGADVVCVDGAGNVFVREYNTNNVLQVSQEGDRKLAQIVSQSDGISTWALCFDNVNTRLLVASCEASDTVTVLQLKQ